MVMTDTFSEHRNVVQNLERIISSFIKNKSCVVLSETEFKWEGVPDVYKPDVSLLCGPRRKDGTYYSDVPRFIAEVLSDSTEQDERGKKMEVYASVGVEEYWLIDWRVQGGKIERYLLDDSGEHYLLHDILLGSEKQDLSLILFPSVKFKITELQETDFSC